MMMQVAQHNSQSAHRAARLRFALQMAEQAQKVGDRIAEEREKRNWSRPELARQMPGVSTGNDVYRWENGKHLPRADTLEALATVFGITVADLHSGPVAEQDETEGEEGAATESEAADGETRELLHQVLDQQAELLAKIDEVLDEQERQRQLQAPGEQTPGGS